MCCQINSQCIRLNTGSTPETEGIMSILKLNNVKLCYLVEHNSNDMDNLAKVIIKLFLDDGLIGTLLKIGGENVKLKNNPWEEVNSNALPLRNGRSTFFLTQINRYMLSMKKQVKQVMIKNLRMEKFL